MIHVVGGSYFEHCITPKWNYLYGSGLRAAAALSSLSNKITFHTCIGEHDVELLLSIASTYGLEVNYNIIPHTIAFRYFHSLSFPQIFYTSSDVMSLQTLSVEAENIICFGMLDANHIVDGEFVVYDPQNPQHPQRFDSNGSKANKLAIVANFREASILSGKFNISDIGNVLLEEHKADVVIIKRGVIGAIVITSGQIVTVPPYFTDNVWPIGSGDIFAATFAYFWTEMRLDPVKSAELASIATANYCNTPVLPIKKDFSTNHSFKPIVINERYENEPNKVSVYLAGPFFTISQRWLVEEVRTALQQIGLTVFSPLHDVGPGSAEQVVHLDIEGIRKSDIVLALMNEKDSGTIFEIGYARAIGIPVVVFTENQTEEDLKMMKGTDCWILNDLTSAIYHTAWRALMI